MPDIITIHHGQPTSAPDFDHTKFMRGCYALPGDPTQDRYLIPLSGGIDSTATAVMMKAAFPDVTFDYVFTDTKADDEGIYATLDRLEAYLGRKIDRIVPEKGLFELIEDQNGFLPSAQDRWCTVQLKLQPYEKYIGWRRPVMSRSLIYTFIGIRFDEPFRSGMISQDDDVVVELPLKAWGIERADVFAIVDQTVGIPSFYRYRVRSGCTCCWGMRRMETIGVLDRHPVEFKKAEQYEKLSAKDVARKRDYVSVPDELGIGHNWVGFPIPRELDIHNRETQQQAFPGWTFFDLAPVPSANVMPLLRRWEGDTETKWKEALATDSSQMSMLDEADPLNRLWVGVEFHIDPGIGGDGVFYQRILTFSTSRSGLSRQLQGHWEHRLQTAEACYMTQDEVKSHVKYAVYCIEAPQSDMDTAAPSDGSFTWKHGESYDQIRRLTQFGRRTLNAERFAQDERKARQEGRHGYADTLKAQCSAIGRPLGRVLGMGSFIPKEVLAPTEEEDERYATCFACSV